MGYRQLKSPARQPDNWQAGRPRLVLIHRRSSRLIEFAQMLFIGVCATVTSLLMCMVLSNPPEIPESAPVSIVATAERAQHVSPLVVTMRAPDFTDFIAEKIKRTNPVADAEELASTIRFVAQKANYDPIFLAALIRVRSNFGLTPAKNTANSKHGYGLLFTTVEQGRASAASAIWNSEKFKSDVKYNLGLTVLYLRALENHYGSRVRGLEAFAAGSTLENEAPILPRMRIEIQEALRLHRNWTTELLKNKRL